MLRRMQDGEKYNIFPAELVKFQFIELFKSVHCTLAPRTCEGGCQPLKGLTGGVKTHNSPNSPSQIA